MVDEARRSAALERAAAAKAAGRADESTAWEQAATAWSDGLVGMASMWEREARRRERENKVQAGNLLRAAESIDATVSSRIELWNQMESDWNRADAAWEHASEGWVEGDTEATLIWVRAAIAWVEGNREAATAWERLADALVGDGFSAWAWAQAAKAWSDRRGVGNDSARVAEAWECVARYQENDLDLERVALAWDRAAREWPLSGTRAAGALEHGAKRLRAGLLDANCIEEALSTWVNAAQARVDSSPKQAAAWACAAVACVLANSYQAEDARAWGQAAKAWATGRTDVAEAWENSAVAWVEGNAVSARRLECTASAIDARKSSIEARAYGKARLAKAWESAAVAWDKEDVEAALAWESVARDA